MVLAWQRRFKVYPHFCVKVTGLEFDGHFVHYQVSDLKHLCFCFFSFSSKLKSGYVIFLVLKH